MRRPIPEVTIPRGPWYCVLDLEWRLLYLGTDEFEANVAASLEGAVMAKADRMGDAPCDAAIAVATARRARSPKPARGDRGASPSPAVRSRAGAFAS